MIAVHIKYGFDTSNKKNIIMKLNSHRCKFMVVKTSKSQRVEFSSNCKIYHTSELKNVIKLFKHLIQWYLKILNMSNQWCRNLQGRIGLLGSREFSDWSNSSGIDDKFACKIPAFPVTQSTPKSPTVNRAKLDGKI